MKIKTISSIIFWPMIALVSYDLTIGMKLYSSSAQMNEVVAKRKVMRSICEELRMEAAALGKFANRYVVTGDKNVLNWYNQIISFRSGAASRPKNYNTYYWDLVSAGLIQQSPPDDRSKASTIEQLENKVLSSFVNERLIEHFAKSQKVASFEKRALDAFEGKADENLGVFAAGGSPNRDLALKILNDASYVKAKGEAIKPLQEASVIIEKETTSKLVSLKNNSDRLINLGLTATGVLFLWMLSCYIYFHVRIMKRIDELGSSAMLPSGESQKSYGPHQDGDELDSVALSINNLSNSLKAEVAKSESMNKKIEGLNSDISMEKHYSMQLLKNIVPESLSERLRDGSLHAFDAYAQASIFMLKIMNIRQLFTNIGAHQCIEIMGDLFDGLDELSDQYNVEKIKTAGDCYIAATGLPISDPLHCQHMAEFAIKAREITGEISENYSVNIDVQIALHTGKVIAGVVGKKMLSFDVWGDAVEACRGYLETAPRNTIHVSHCMYARLSESFVFVKANDFRDPHTARQDSWYLLGQIGQNVPSSEKAFRNSQSVQLKMVRKVS